MVLNVVQVKLHKLGLLLTMSVNSLFVLVFKDVEFIFHGNIALIIGANPYFLSDLELNFIDGRVALAIVNSDHCLSNLISVEDILLETDIEARLASWLGATANIWSAENLVIAAVAAGVGHGGLLIGIDHELHRRLMHNQQLLVLKHLVVLGRDQCLDSILDLD